MMNPLGLSCPGMVDNVHFFDTLHQLSAAGHKPLCLFGTKENKLFAVMASSDDIKVSCTEFPTAKAYPSLSIHYPSFQIFEREIYEEYGIVPIGHPWLKPIRHPQGDILDYPFFKSNSILLNEVGVGPVHAGVIEPGHFRFICRGEVVENLEIQLGYQHRGLLNLMCEGDLRSKTQLAECIAGDTVIGHTTAYSMVVEKLSDCPPANVNIRAIALEMERVAMHLSVLSALAGDVAYIMGQNLFAALRTTIITSSLAICGSRFGKRWITPGGVNYGISDSQKETLGASLKQAGKQIRDTALAMLNNTSVLSRFDDTGVITYDEAIKYGFTGITAKCCGAEIDARMEYPWIPLPDFTPITENSGDVYARAHVRFLEIMQSLDLIQNLLATLQTEEPLANPIGCLKPNSIAMAIVEGYRGRIVHIAATDAESNTLFYRAIDPSMINWQALQIAVKNEGISDFPLCNKSFDFSYCGSDL